MIPSRDGLTRCFLAKQHLSVSFRRHSPPGQSASRLSQAFGKELRLSKERDFERAIKHGTTVRRPPIRLLYLRKQEPPIRLGIWAAKRDFRRAADRNRVKRWVREFFRKRRLDILFPCDVIVQVFRSPAASDHSLLDLALERAFGGGGLLKP